MPLSTLGALKYFSFFFFLIAVTAQWIFSACCSAYLTLHLLIPPWIFVKSYNHCIESNIFFLL